MPRIIVAIKLDHIVFRGWQGGWVRLVPTETGQLGGVDGGPLGGTHCLRMLKSMVLHTLNGRGMSVEVMHKVIFDLGAGSRECPGGHGRRASTARWSIMGGRAP